MRADALVVGHARGVDEATHMVAHSADEPTARGTGALPQRSGGGERGPWQPSQGGNSKTRAHACVPLSDARQRCASVSGPPVAAVVSASSASLKLVSLAPASRALSSRALA